MSLRSNGLQRLAGALSLALVAGCASSAPQEASAESAEHRRQIDSLTRALEAERQRADTATLEATARQRQSERLQNEVDAAHATNAAQLAALNVAVERVKLLAGEAASVGSQTPTELEGAAALLRTKEQQIRTLRDELARARARQESGEAASPARPNDGHVRLADLDLEVAVATIDGDPLTRREFCEYLFRDLGTPGLLDLFINRALVTREARDRHVVVDDVAVAVWVEGQLVDQIGQAGSEAAFDEQLHERGYSRESWLARLRYQARPQLLLERLVLLERTTPEGKDAFESRIREVYERDYSERVTARQIFVKYPASADPAEVELCRQKAELALSEVQKGRPFADVVARRSEDALQTKRIGGSLGTFDRTRFASEQALNSAFFTATAGTPSGPVRSSLGFHVLLVDEHKPPTRPFDAATRQLILKTIEREPPSDPEMIDLVTRLRARSHVVTSLSFD